MTNKPHKEETKLVPKSDFTKVLKKVLDTSKEESDRQLAEFQASNKAKREKKRRNDDTEDHAAHTRR